MKRKAVSQIFCAPCRSASLTHLIKYMNNRNIKLCEQLCLELIMYSEHALMGQSHFLQEIIKISDLWKELDVVIRIRFPAHFLENYDYISRVASQPAFKLSIIHPPTDEQMNAWNKRPTDKLGLPLL